MERQGYHTILTDEDRLCSRCGHRVALAHDWLCSSCRDNLETTWRRCEQYASLASPSGAASRRTIEYAPGIQGAPPASG